MACRTHHPVRPSQAPERRTAVGVADIFRTFGEAYRRDNRLTPHQYAVMTAIEACRTAALGGHLDTCACGYERPSYNSCRNRHCPTCQLLEQVKWVESRSDRVLPVPHFHVVFTLPHEINPIAMRNKSLVYDMLFDSASGALLEIAADPAYLGAQPGVTMVLHTWDRELNLHPHVHAVVTGGGLEPGTGRWVSTPPDFLLPIHVLGALFRGKFLAALKAARDQRKLDLRGNPPAKFNRLLGTMYAKKWVVHAERPFGGALQVIRYLGGYVHRTGISNNRIVSMDQDAVSFKTRNGRTATLPPHEFIRRFLLHMLPKRFVRIRHFGLLASGNVNTRLAAARRAFGAPDPQPRPAPGWRELMTRLTGIDPMRCPRCGATLVRRPLPDISEPPASTDDRAEPQLEDSS